MLELLSKLMLIYLVFGIVYSTYRLKKDYKRAYWMLSYTNVKRPRLVMFGNYIMNILMWIPRIIDDMFNID